MKHVCVDVHEFILVCNNCYDVINDGNGIIKPSVDCWLCNVFRVTVCEECSYITGGKIQEIPYLQKQWVCDKCFEEPIPPNDVFYVKYCKNKS